MECDYAKTRILLVDDDKASHLFHRTILRKHGFELLSAYNGQEGLQTALAVQPDLILLDYMMPGMNGEEVLAEIAGNPDYARLQKIPVVMLTAANHSPGEKADLLENGLSVYLERPFGEHELRNVIENVFIKHRQEIARAEILDGLQKSRDFFERIMRNFPGVIFTTDLEGRITFIGGTSVRGRQAEKRSRARTLFDYCRLQPKDYDELYHKLLHSQEIVIIETELCVDPDRRESIPAELSLTLFRNSSDEISGILCIARDLTLQKRLEQEKLEKERVVTLAQTMATVNHEINNPLTPILGNTQLLLQSEAHLSADVRAKLTTILENAKRIASTVQKLSNLSQPILTGYYGGEKMIHLDKSL